MGFDSLPLSPTSREPEKTEPKKIERELFGEPEKSERELFDSNLFLKHAVSQERQKCLDTLLYIAEVEEYYQTLAAEVDTRALTLASAPCPTEEDEEANDDNAVLGKTYNDCIYAVRATWDWLGKASRCMDIHLHNAAAYHQFVHEARHCDAALGRLMSRLHRQSKAPRERDVTTHVTYIRETTRQLLDVQAKTARLFARSSDIVPLRLRKDPISEPLRALALVDYFQSDIVLTQREEVELLDTSQSTKWRVRTSEGVEASVPALVILIPPPERSAVQEGQRLRMQLLSTWQAALTTVKKRARFFFESFLHSRSADSVACLSCAARKEVRQCLDDMGALLTADLGEEVSEAEQRCLEGVASWKVGVSKMMMQETSKGEAKMVASMTEEWNGNSKLIKQVKELQAYVTSFAEEVDSTREVTDLLVRDDDGNVKYVSNAYIERCSYDDADTVEEVLPVELVTDTQSHLTLTEKTPLPADDEGLDLVDFEEITEEIRAQWESESVSTTELARSKGYSMEEYSSQTIRETKTFVIVGVIDPRNDEKVSIYQAINEGIISQAKGAYVNPDSGESMPIPEAMSRKLILVEYTNRMIEEEAIKRGVITTMTTKERISYTVEYVIDVTSGKKISAQDAIAKGIIDQHSGRYINPATGDSISIADAIEKGMIAIESTDSQERKTRWVPKDYVITSVYDPKNHRQLPLDEALRRNLINKTKGVYMDPRNCDEYSFDEAIGKGYISARAADPLKDKNNPNRVSCRVLQTMDEVDFTTGRLKTIVADVEASIYAKISEDVDVTAKSIKDPSTGRMFSLEEAFEEGILQMNPPHIVDMDGNRYSLQEAAARGLIDDSIAVNMLKAISANSLDQVIEDGLINPHTGKYRDPKTGAMMSIAEAIKRDLLDPSHVFYTDPITKSIISLSAAIDQGKFNPESGRFVDPATGREISIAEAIEKGLLEPEVDAESIAKQIAALKFLKENMDTSIKGIRLGPECDELSVEEAVVEGSLQLTPLQIVDRSGKKYSLVEAAASGLLEANTAMELLNAVEPNALEKSIYDGRIDPIRGLYVDIKTRETKPLGEAMKDGYLDPDTIFYTDGESRDILTLGTAMDEEKFNPKTGRFVDAARGREVSIQDAIDEGLVIASIDAGSIAEQIAALKFAKENGLDNCKKGVFAPDGQEMSVQDAIMNGILNLSPLSVIGPDGKRYGLKDAVTLGLIDSETAMELLKAIENNSLKNLIDQGLINPKTGEYVDPKSGKSMSIADAVRLGLLDPEKVFLTDPVTGDVISLAQAIEDGAFNPVTGRIRDPKTGREISIDKAMERGVLQPAINSGKMGDQIKSLQFLKDTVDMSKGGIRGRNGEEMSVEDAIMAGLLQLNPLSVLDSNGKPHSIAEAVALGLIDADTAMSLLKAVEDNSIESLIANGTIDAKTGQFIDPETGKSMPISEAIRLGLLDPEKVFLKDPATGEVVSLAAAIECGNFNPLTGRIKDPETARDITLAQAIAKGLIKPNVGKSKAVEQISALKFLKEHMDTSMTGVKDPFSGGDLSVNEAVIGGVLDMPRAQYVDDVTDTRTPIPQAVNDGVIAAATAKALYGAMREESLAKALAQGRIDPNIGKDGDWPGDQVLHPEKNRKVTFKEAAEAGFLDPSTIFLTDPHSQQAASLQAFTEQGRFNPVTGKFKDAVSGLEVSMPIAIRKGVVDPEIDPDKLIADQCTVSALLADGKLNPKDLIFVTPDGHKMSLKEAIAAGVLSGESVVRVEPTSGFLSLATEDRAGIVAALLDSGRQLAWVAAIEKRLAGMDAGSDEALILAEQITAHMAVQNEVDKEGTTVAALVDDCTELLDNNRSDTADAGVLQQHTRLKTNITDLKQRFDSTASELALRLRSMEEMRAQLADLDMRSGDLTTWAVAARERMAMVRQNLPLVGDEAELVADFKKFSDDAQGKKGELKAFTNVAKDVQEKAKECEKSGEKFREIVGASLPDAADDSKVVQQQVDDTSAQVNSAIAECGELASTLDAYADKHGRYNRLKRQLAKSLPPLEAAMLGCCAELSPERDPQAQMDDIKRVAADVIAEGAVVEELQKIGTELVAILNEMGCENSAKCNEILEDCSWLVGKYGKIHEGVVEKQTTLNAAIVKSQDVQHNLDAMLSWVNESEAVFDDVGLISLDRAQLAEQIQAHRVLVNDIESHRTQAQSVAEQCRGTAGAEAKVEQLVDRFDVLEARAHARGAELEEMSQRLDAVHDSVAMLETWVATSMTSLRRESVDDPAALKEKIETLYRTKQGKLPELDQVKRDGRDLVDDARTGNKSELRSTLADMQQQWHDLTELLVQKISFAAIREIDDLLKYLDRAENEIITAEHISTDPETLAQQLRDHKAFHDDLEAKRAAVNATIDKCNKMLRETTNEEADEIKSKLDTIRSQADLVCRLSKERLGTLEEALPLASHFSEMHADLEAWLGEVEAEIASLDLHAEASPEQIRKTLDNAKTTQRIIEDHKPLVEDLTNTGHELSEMCSDEDANDLKADVEHVNGKYDQVKAAIREKLNHADDALRHATTDVGDTIEGLLEELHYFGNMAEHCDPIAANPDVIRDQIAENNTLAADVERRAGAIAAAKENVRHLLDSRDQSADAVEEYEDMRSKLQELDELQESIRAATAQRADQLVTALDAAEQFQGEYQDVVRALRDIQDNLASQDSPGVDPNTVYDQQKELKAIQEELASVLTPLEACRLACRRLEKVTGTPAQMELQKLMEDLDTTLEDIQEGTKEREDELTSALDKAVKFDDTLQTILSWLPKAEEKIAGMLPVAAQPRAVRIQIEELKVFGVQVRPRYMEIQHVQQLAAELRQASPVTAESLTPHVKDVTARWTALLQTIQDREQALKEALVVLGELDHALDDMVGYLTQTEADLQALDNVVGDPKFIEAHLKKLSYMLKDLAVQEPAVRKLNEAVDEMVRTNGNQGMAQPFVEKQDELNELYKAVQITARDKQNQLQDILMEAKSFLGDVDDLIRWMTDFRNKLRSSSPMGALPDTAQKQFEKFMNEFRGLEQKEEEVQALLINGEDMVARCQEGDTATLATNLTRLKEGTFNTKEKACKKQTKMEEHLSNVQDFHAMLKIHTDWLNNAEKILGSFKHPSKLVERVLQQIQEHREFRDDVETHREIMMNLDRTGTYLKYFGRKQDTVYIKNLLISIKLRWKKLVRRADEKGRLLQQAYKEDKRFHDAWLSLCEWLDEGEHKLKKYTQNTPTKVKQDIDELKHFQHELAAKHPVHYSTMRLGRSLKDRCTKSDPERDVLQSMLDDLKNKWSIVRSIVAQRQNKLDEALMSSGRFADALQSLLEWLSKAESYLSEEQPILGDLDTVTILIEQHKAFQQELASRQSMVNAMGEQAAADPALGPQIGALMALWERVNQLADVREARLGESTKLAEDFNDAVQVVREWLPRAEAELKFKALPEDEDAIVALIESHEAFQDELRAHQSNVERIKFLADEILQACHPNAVRFVKYYLTITQTRWEQALQRAEQRSTRLQEALRGIRGNAALLEELLAWLTEGQALLSAKEKDPIPEDLTIVDTLLKEHLEFHDDLAQKSKDADRLSKMPNPRDGKSGSQWNLQNGEGSPSAAGGARVTALQNKWRSVWRLSVDRKKKLQDAMDQLLELESFKNFDFELWRQRYMQWIRSKKLRITDFFRRVDKDGDGCLTRDEFVEGMLSSKFPTNRTELNAVFEIFDRNRSGELDYQEFVNALRPERRTRASTGRRPLTDTEVIHDEIEVQVSRCQCRQQFKVTKVADGKYKFGEKGKLCMVRFLNNTVMVRVGGGWVTLTEFLETNDPCKAKGRTNAELREQLKLGDSMQSFTPRGRKVSTPSRNGDGGQARSESTASLPSSPSGSMTNLSSTGSNRRGTPQPGTPRATRRAPTSSSTSQSAKRATNGDAARAGRAPSQSGKNTPSTPSSTRSKSPAMPSRNGVGTSRGQLNGAPPAPQVVEAARQAAAARRLSTPKAR